MHVILYTITSEIQKKLQWDFRSEISKQRETNILAVLRF